MATTLAILAVLAAAVAGVLVAAARRPDSFRVSRTATIEAPPEKIFPLINELRRWEGWSPWERKDPAMRRTLSGPASGVGAAYAWDGDRNVGRGRMEIVEAAPPSKVVLRLDFVKPFEAHNAVEFALAPQGGATAVTWAMHGPSPFLSRLIGLFLNLDRMIGRDFEAGLAGLKALAEK